jgi:putative hemolysin
MAPQAFDNCRKSGGKIRTLTLKGGKYMHVCILNGKSYRGEIKTKQTSSSGESPVAAAIKQKMR